MLAQPVGSSYSILLNSEANDKYLLTRIMPLFPSQGAHCYGDLGMPKSINSFKKDKFSEKNPNKTKQLKKTQQKSEREKYYFFCFISYTSFTLKCVLLSGIRLWMPWGETLAITHCRFCYMNSVYYNEQRIVNKILKYKGHLRKKRGRAHFYIPGI